MLPLKGPRFHPWWVTKIPYAFICGQKKRKERNIKIHHVKPVGTWRGSLSQPGEISKCFLAKASLELSLIGEVKISQVFLMREKEVSGL